MAGHDVSRQPREPAGSPAGGRWTAGAAHPLGTDHATVRQGLKGEATALREGAGDRRGYDKAKPPADVLDKVQAAVNPVVAAAAATTSVGLPIAEVYDKVKDDLGGMSPHAFHAALFHLWDAGRVRLSGWSKSVDEMPRPEHAVPVGSRHMYYIQPSEKAMSTDLTPWRAKKLPDDSFAYLVPDAEIRTDGAKMVAHVVVSTQTMDRERDILISKGCRTASHQKLPAVLVNHRKDWPAVARAEDPDGRYTVKCHDDRVESFNWFDQKSKLGLQTFRLVESKALAGVSPGFMTVPDCVQKIKGSDGHPAFLYTAWDLVEISHCPIPMNPDALVLAVEKGFGGESLVPELKELLLPFVPKKKSQVVGGFETKSAGGETETTTTADPSPIDLSDADAVPLTPSTQFYHAVYQKAFDFLCMAQSLAGAQELDRTKADGRRIVGLIGGVLDACQKGHAGHVNDFPDQPGLPDGPNGDVLATKMSAWRVKAMDAWEEHRRAAAEAVPTESAITVRDAVKLLHTLADDRQQRTSVRAVAKRMADRLCQVKMVTVPAEDDEDMEWGVVATAFDKVLQRAALIGKE